MATTPESNLIADAAGNLFGTTLNGGNSDGGVVHELIKTAAGYASTPTVLVNFDPSNGKGYQPHSALIADAAGDLFGTTLYGGAYGGAPGYGTAFEIVKTVSGYDSSQTVLVNFDRLARCQPRERPDFRCRREPIRDDLRWRHLCQ